MANNYSYRRVSESLAQSLNHFEEVNALFGDVSSEAGSENEANTRLKTRWQTVLTNGLELAEFTRDHHRVQSSPTLAALEELAKYADVRRPFRLSVIGQKGVGKSALVNALLGASDVQYTPSEVAGKAVSGTRIRLVSQNATNPSQPWRVVFLTPRRLWEIGSHLLNVARVSLPKPPTDLNSREGVMQTLQEVLTATAASFQNSAVGQIGSTAQIQSANARSTLAEMLRVYEQQAGQGSLPSDYTLWLDDADVDGPISPYIRQAEDNLYLIIDYVERYLPSERAGFLANRPIELEDVLGLDDPRDSFFALEAFKEAFAVIMVFKCDRGLNTESSSLLANLFSRDENELSQFGDYADLNKAIVVANQFDNVTANIGGGSNANPLKGIEDIRRELSRYTRQPVPIYLTSAQMAQNARTVLQSSPARPSAAYRSYLDSLANLLQVLDERKVAPDYLDFILAKRAEIEGSDPETSGFGSLARARLVLEMSGLPRLEAKVQEALEASSILRGRVANAEYYYDKGIAETARCYARQMQQYKLSLAEFNQPPVSLESRLFSKFQYEMRLKLQELDSQFRGQYFMTAQRYIHGAMPAEVEQARALFLETIRWAFLKNQQLIQMEQHISTGQTVTDAWRKIFEDINDWLALEAGVQLRSSVGPILVEVDRLAASMQKQLAALTISPLEDSFWANYQQRLANLRQRLQTQAEMVSIAYFTDNRFSVYDLQIAERLHVGDGGKRREEVIRLMQERVLTWFNNMWHLATKMAMTELNAFVNEVRHYVLGLPAEGSLLVGLELMGGPGKGQLVPEESVTALLNYRYHASEGFRRQYAMREPSPAERLAMEIRDWFGLLHPPLDGPTELNKAVAMVGAGPSDLSSEKENESGQGDLEDEFGDAVKAEQSGEEQVGASQSAFSMPIPVPTPNLTRLRVPIESSHPYKSVVRQVWEISNPDPQATHTRVHFARIDLGSGTDRIVLQAVGPRQEQIIGGQHTDFWSNTFVGRTINVRFLADNQKPGWGFVLDCVESVTANQTVSV